MNIYDKTFTTLKFAEFKVSLEYATVYHTGSMTDFERLQFLRETYLRWEKKKIVTSFEQNDDGYSQEYGIFLLANMDLVLSSAEVFVHLPYKEYCDGQNGDFWALMMFFSPHDLTSAVRAQVDQFSRSVLRGPFTTQLPGNYLHYIVYTAEYCPKRGDNRVDITPINFSDVARAVNMRRQIADIVTAIDITVDDYIDDDNDSDTNVTTGSLSSVDTTDDDLTVILGPDAVNVNIRRDDDDILRLADVGALTRSYDQINVDIGPILNISDVGTKGFCYLHLFNYCDWEKITLHGEKRLNNLSSIVDMTRVYHLQRDYNVYVIHCLDDKGQFFHLQRDLPDSYRYAFHGCANDCLSYMVNVVFDNSVSCGVNYYDKPRSYYIDKLLRYQYTYHFHHDFKKPGALKMLDWYNQRFAENSQFCPFIRFGEYNEVKTYGKRLFAKCNMFSIYYRFTDEVKNDLRRFFQQLLAHYNFWFFSKYGRDKKPYELWCTDDGARLWYYGIQYKYKPSFYSHNFVQFLASQTPDELVNMRFTSRAIRRFLWQRNYAVEPDLIQL